MDKWIIFCSKPNLSSHGNLKSQTCAHLLDRGVFNSVGAIMIVDDVKVTDRLCLVRSSELSIKFSFACGLCVHSEVSGFVQLHTFKRNRRYFYSLLQKFTLQQKTKLRGENNIFWFILDLKVT